MSESNNEIAKKLNTAWRFFSAQGYVDGFGHINARTDDSDKNLNTPHSWRPGATPD